MMHTSTVLKGIGLCVLMGAASATVAETRGTDYERFNVQLNIGQTNMDINGKSFDGIGAELIAGYFFFPGCAIEVGYSYKDVDINNFDLDINGIKTGFRFGGEIVDNLDIYAFVGAIRQNAEINGLEKDSVDAYWGAGARYALSNSVGVTVSYEQSRLGSDFDDETVGMMAVGLSYRFGQAHTNRVLY